MNEPEFRFKADDGSEFPEWEQQKLSDIADYSKDKISATNVSPEDYVSTDNMLQDYAGIVDSETVPNTGTLCSFKSGDILMSNIRPYLKKIWLANKNGGCNSDVLVIRPNNSQNPQFVFALLARDDFISYVMTGAKGSKMPRGDKAFIMNYAIPDICIEEQQKIADLFSALDNVIVSVQKEVDSWEQMKRGVMQKLFGQEVRFKADDGSEFPEWKYFKVRDLFDLNKEINKNGDIENVITNSAEFGLIPQREFFDKDIAVEGNTDKYTIIKKGDFVYNPRKSSSAPYGPFNCYKYDQEGIVSPLYFCLKPKYTEMSAYLECYFASTLWHSYIYNNGAQSGARHDRVGMTNELLLNIPVSVPCFEEQQKIADCLSEFDLVIEKTKQKLEAYKQLKKGLMQRMFV